MGVIGNMLFGDPQAEATEDAAQIQSDAADRSIDAQMEMWNKAQTDFAPYLQGGYQGLTALTQAMPQYVNQVLAPIAQQYGNFRYSALPNANFTVNPITGQVTSTQVPQQTTQAAGGNAGSQLVSAQQTAPGGRSPYSGATAGLLSQQSQQAVAPGGRSPYSGATAGMMYAGGSQTFNEAAGAQSLPALAAAGVQATPAATPAAATPAPAQTIANPEFAQWQRTFGGMQGEGVPVAPQQTITNPAYTQWQAQQTAAAAAPATPAAATPTTPMTPAYSGPTPSTMPQLAFNQQVTQPQYSLANVASTSDLSQGGVLSPNVPTFNQGGAYTFNEQDPTYQIMLQAKNTEIDNFLAKQGLQGSSAGEAFRQRQLDQLRAAQDATQYGRFTGERDYNTQTALDQYQAEAARGSDLYNRVYGQSTDLYNRNLTGTQLSDQQRLGQLSNQYSIAGDLYNTLYGNAYNLSTLGQGTASSSGNAAMQTGANMSNIYQNQGDVQSQLAMVSGMNQANIRNGLVQQPANAYSMYSQIQQQQQPNYYSGGGYYGGNVSGAQNYGGTNYYTNSGGNYAGY